MAATCKADTQLTVGQQAAVGDLPARRADKGSQVQHASSRACAKVAVLMRHSSHKASMYSTDVIIQ